MRLKLRWAFAVGAAWLAASPALSAQRVSATDLAACAAGDQAVCLLKLSTRQFGAPFIGDEVAFAYTPDLVREATPPPSVADDVLRSLRSFHPENSAAIDVLHADAAGADPAPALRALHIPRASLDEPAEKPAPLRVEQRVRAYARMIELANNPIGRGKNHQPTPALLSAVQEAGCRDLADLDNGKAAMEFVQAEVHAGLSGPMRACLRGIHKPNPQIASAYLALQLWDEAVAALSATVTSGGDDGAGELVELNSERQDAIAALLRAGQTNQAVTLARLEVESVLDAPDPAPDMKLHPPDSFILPQGLGAATAVSILVKFGPRAEALGAVERLDAVARVDGSYKALVTAGLAVRGWTDAGEPARAKSLVDDLTARAQACTTPKTCATPDLLKLIVAMSSRLPEEGLPTSMANSPHSFFGALAFLVAMSNGRRDVLDARLAHADDEERRKAIGDCLDGALSKQEQLASYCLGLADAAAKHGDADLAAAVDANLKAAGAAAEAGKIARMHQFLDHALAHAGHSVAATPRLRAEDLRAIAITELREQGRL